MWCGVPFWRVPADQHCWVLPVLLNGIVDRVRWKAWFSLMGRGSDQLSGLEMWSGGVVAAVGGIGAVVGVVVAACGWWRLGLNGDGAVAPILRPPDLLGEKNPSPTFKTLSTIEQITADNEMGCQNPKPNEFQPDSFEDLNFRNTEIGSIADMLSDWDFLALEEEPSLEGHVSGSVNLTVAACSDPAPCQHLMPTIPDTMTTTHMMPHLTAKGDMRFVTLKVTYGKKIIKFQFPLMSGIIELKEEVKKRLKLELDCFDIEYKDEDGDCIFLGCDEDLRNHLQLFSNQVIRLLVVDSDANTANFR
ncbi:hypothetical protein RHGRI_038717 [Rhododendron griersonianum]|uniref:PB1 domain-containing protein n=1 Tax=Rhododendron griersonianum TaxID=479676 RepID=A0AAV6HM19_9ERIC|nr:hypothetical protein RHGRI_038717 [Rhododendron griersonianum]